MDEGPGVAVLMFVAHRDAEAQVMTALREAGFGDITLAQSRVLQRLAPAGLRLTDLAEQARVTKQTAGALVDQLEHAGYVSRRPDPTDARARLVTLTDRGAVVCRTAQAEVTRIERSWRKHLGNNVFDTLLSTLTSLREITDPYR